MKKIRIGKDIDVTWTITTNGVATALEASRLTVVMVPPYGQRTNITGLTIATNVLTFHIGHEIQSGLGIYRMELWQDLGTKAQTVVDKLQAWELVPYTTDEGDDDDSNITTSYVDLDTSSLTIGGSNVVVFDEAPDSNLYGRTLTTSGGKWKKIDEKPETASYVTYAEANLNTSTNVFSCSVSGVTELKNGLCLALHLNSAMQASSTLSVNGLTALPFRAFPNTNSFYSRYPQGSVILVTCSLDETNDSSKGWWICDYSAPAVDVKENDEYAYGTFVNDHPGSTLIAWNRDGNFTSLYQKYSGGPTRSHNKTIVDYSVDGSKISTDSHIYFLGASFNAGSTPSEPLSLIRTYSMNSGQVANCWNVDLVDDTLAEASLVAAEFTPGAYVYMVGSISDGEFQLKDLDFVTALPTAEDGYYYWQIGKYVSTSAFMLTEDQPIYFWSATKGGIRRYIRDLMEIG